MSSPFTARFWRTGSPAVRVNVLCSNRRLSRVNHNCRFGVNQFCRLIIRYWRYWIDYRQASQAIEAEEDGVPDFTIRWPREGRVNEGRVSGLADQRHRQGVLCRFRLLDLHFQDHPDTQAALGSGPRWRGTGESAGRLEEPGALGAPRYRPRGHDKPGSSAALS